MTLLHATPPTYLGDIDANCPEYMYYVYLPILFPKTSWDVRLPKNLEWTRNLVDAVLADDVLGRFDLYESYVYLTVKHMFVDANTYPNRPGWHIDGFGTDDLNYIWYTDNPTLFCIQDFELSDDHEKSMLEMEQQVDSRNIMTYSPYSLLRLNNKVVHAVAPRTKSGIRTFVKISVSRHKYNLEGNSHNYLFNYDWQMYKREETRNHPIG